jgi:hypothetical protein
MTKLEITTLGMQAAILTLSLQRNSALRMRTICFAKPVSELILPTGLTEEVSDPSLSFTNRDLCQQGKCQLASL